MIFNTGFICWVVGYALLNGIKNSGYIDIPRSRWTWTHIAVLLGSVGLYAGGLLAMAVSLALFLGKFLP